MMIIRSPPLSWRSAIGYALAAKLLEAERDSFKRGLQAQVQASESLKADNTKLYERYDTCKTTTRILQSRRWRQCYNRNSRVADRDLDLEALALTKHRWIRSDNLASRAAAQAQGNVSMERTVFIVAKTVLGKLCLCQWKKRR
jgi:hypothetical protein